jgi:hypothetical protein
MLHVYQTQNVAASYLDVPRSNFGPETAYPYQSFSQFSSVPTCEPTRKHQGSKCSVNQATTVYLLILSISFFTNRIRRYRAWTTDSVVK